MAAMRQVTLRHQVTLNLNAAEVSKYGLEQAQGTAPGPAVQGQGARVVTLPAGLVNIPEELCEHWYVKAAIEEGKRPLMGGPRIDPAAQAAAAQEVLKPAAPAAQEVGLTPVGQTIPATDTNPSLTNPASDKVADPANPAQTGTDATGQAGQTQAETKTETETKGIKPEAELRSMSDDDLRAYLADVGKQKVSAQAPRDKVLARIEKLRD